MAVCHPQLPPTWQHLVTLMEWMNAMIAEYRDLSEYSGPVCLMTSWAHGTKATGRIYMLLPGSFIQFGTCF